VISAVKGTVANLERIYKLQSQNVSFTSPSDMFATLGLRNLTQVSAYDYLEGKLDITPSFVEEFVDGASRDNYGQDGAINALVDLVSLAGAGIAGSVFSLANGTTPIVGALLDAPAIRVRVATAVAAIEATSSRYRVSYQPSDGPPDEQRAGGAPSSLAAEEYDAVAVATPLEVARGLKLLRSEVTVNASRPYQRTCVTFVCGVVSPLYFGLGAAAHVPTELLTVENASLPFTTLAVHATLPNGSKVYKLFSRQPLSEPLLDKVFASRSRTRRLDWAAAYPQLRPSPPEQTWPPFEIPLRPPPTGAQSGAEVRSDGTARPVLYVNAMESPVSCMETQLIAAKNAALRIVKLLDAQAAAQAAAA